MQAANALIPNNPKLFEKKLRSEHGQGGAIHVQTCRDGDLKAQWMPELAVRVAGSARGGGQMGQGP